MGSFRGRSELANLLAECRPAMRAAILFSVFVNLLMLTSPLFMLQVYDRVLASHSVETLAALMLLVTVLFLILALLDLIRAQVMARVSARMQAQLEARVFTAAQQQTDQGRRASALPDLEAISRFYASPGYLALVDLPWVPVFLAATALFHPWLGLLAFAGGAVSILITLLNQRGSMGKLGPIAEESQSADFLLRRLNSEAELVAALGMKEAAFSRWQRHRARLSKLVLASAETSARWTAIGRSFRLYLQSAILALAALLVLRGEVSGGAMVAASILTGRALAPVDQLLAYWPVLMRARDGRQRLEAILSDSPPQPAHLPLPRPEARLSLHQLSVSLPGSDRPCLAGLSAELAPGQALAVIGASGSGKTTLARCLTGVLPLQPDMVRLGAAPLAAYGDDLGRWIGYLPQRVQLFDGTIAENIARLAENPDPAAVLAAASRAGLHQQILSLPRGYETWVQADAPGLSGGQIQRIGLARALYGDPVLIVLDEPDSNLDHEGCEALATAIRQLKAEGKLVVIMAHRPAALRDCDLVLILDAGRPRAFGPAAEILRDLLRQMANPAASPPPGAAEPFGPMPPRPAPSVQSA